MGPEYLGNHAVEIAKVGVLLEEGGRFPPLDRAQGMSESDLPFLLERGPSAIFIGEQ